MSHRAGSSVSHQRTTCVSSSRLTDDHVEVAGDGLVDLIGIRIVATWSLPRREAAPGRLTLRVSGTTFAIGVPAPRR